MDEKRQSSYSDPATVTPLELLQKTDVFASMPAAHLEQLASRLVKKEFAKGARIVIQGSPGDSLFIIESGIVGVFTIDDQFGLEVEVAQLGPNDCFGELSIITGGQRNATCTALSNAVAYQLEKSIFEAVLQQSPAVQRDLLNVVARRLSATSISKGVPFISLSRYEADPSLAALIPEKLVKRYSLVPVSLEEGTATVAAVDPSNATAFMEIKPFLQGIRIRPVACSKDDFDRFVEKMGAVAGKATPAETKAAVESIRFLDEAEVVESGPAPSGAEILDLVNLIIVTGIKLGASDIHIEPTRHSTQVRYRIHGTLERKIPEIPSEAHKTLISRFKVLASLDITEVRKPQEGRISIEVAGRPVDLRLSLIPTKLGQKLVMRVLDSATTLMELERLVLAERVRQVVRNMFYAPHGVILITGPTGSGKTTTMYSALLERRNAGLNIVTVEDPIEFHLDGLNQVEVGMGTGLGFAHVLHSFLRQDPDIVLVGETRDAETARLALQAGMTGRLVLTSFHTNDCASAVIRLFEMGMEPFALANALVGVIHQRLVRRLCPHCKVPYEYFPQVLENLRAAGVIGQQVPTMYRSQGCDKCQGQGYQGRVSAMEVLVMTERVRAAIARQASTEEILGAASDGAFVSLARYMRFLLKHGLTSPGEALGALPRSAS